MLYQDEASFYRQPTPAWLWALQGRKQPRMRHSCHSNAVTRAAGFLNARTGETHVFQAPQTDVAMLCQSYRDIMACYPDALMVYLIQDNWPVHFHQEILKCVAQLERLVILPLPTYAPWLNPIEKLWRWTRQTLCHAHEFAADLREFKKHLQASLAEARAMPGYIARYCGLGSLWAKLD